MHAQDISEDGVFDAPEEIIDDLNDEVGMIAFRLQHAGRAHDFARNIDLVLLQVERLVLGGAVKTLCQEDLCSINDALGLAAEAGYSTPPVGVTRDQTMLGLGLLARAVVYWALPDAQRAARTKQKFALRQGLRVFRNALHNSCLLADITDAVSASSLKPLPSHIADLATKPELLDFPTDALRGFAEAFSSAA